VKVSLILADLLPLVENEVRPLLAKSIKHCGGRYDIEDVIENITTKRQQLWVAFDEADHNKIIAAFTTHVLPYPQIKALVVQFLGGVRVHEWIHIADDSITRFASDQGCEFIEAPGRFGWDRVHSDKWTRESVTYRKEVPHNVDGLK